MNKIDAPINTMERKKCMDYLELSSDWVQEFEKDRLVFCLKFKRINLQFSSKTKSSRTNILIELMKKVANKFQFGVTMMKGDESLSCLTLFCVVSSDHSSSKSEKSKKQNDAISSQGFKPHLNKSKVIFSMPSLGYKTS